MPGFVVVPQPVPLHATPVASIMPSYFIIRPNLPNFAELRAALRADNLVESVIKKIPKLTGREHYVGGRIK